MNHDERGRGKRVKAEREREREKKGNLIMSTGFSLISLIFSPEKNFEKKSRKNEQGKERGRDGTKKSEKEKIDRERRPHTKKCHRPHQD